MIYFSVYGRTADGRVEVKIMLSQLLVVAVVEVGAELGKISLFPFSALRFNFLLNIFFAVEGYFLLLY